MAFILVNAINGSSQINFIVNSSLGYSTAGNRNLLTAKGVLSNSIAGFWHYSPHVLGYSEISLAFMQTGNSYFQSQRARTFGFGLGSVLFKSKENSYLFVVPTYSTFIITTNDQKPKVDRSDWNQLGLKILGVYPLSKRFGVTLSYTRHFAMHFDSNNYQSFISAGLIFQTKSEKRMDEKD
jgi:hypothetical protein